MMGQNLCCWHIVKRRGKLTNKQCVGEREANLADTLCIREKRRNFADM
jgi:hypothetical protein